MLTTECRISNADLSRAARNIRYSQDPDRIVIGVESHQTTDLGSDVILNLNLDLKDGESDDHSARSFVPALTEKKMGMSAAETGV